MQVEVNDRYFVSDVTSYAAGNFTAVRALKWECPKNRGPKTDPNIL